jgi:MFS transporter, PAT family, beta-lactamase induction signal transducer AmpG
VQTKRNFTLPSLSESSGLRYITFVLLYFSQGIPEGITIFAIPAWLAINGKSAAEIAGYGAVIMIPFSLKILLAPIMERYTYLPMGRRRPWLLFGQLGIFGSLIALSTLKDPLNHLFELSMIAVCVHIFIMFQDIATDSLVIDIVPLEQQGKANSFMWGAKTVGTSVTLFSGSLLLNTYGPSATAIIMSSAILLIMFLPLSVRERVGEKRVPWGRGEIAPESKLLAVDSWIKLWKSFRQVILLPNTLLLLLALFITMASIHFMRTLFPLFVIQELHWDNVAYGSAYSTYSLIGGILGMLIGGLAILRLGLVKFLQTSLLLMLLTGISLALSSDFWTNNFVIHIFLAVFATLVTMITIGSLALSMHLCWKRISALQFTFCMTIFNLGLSSGAALFGLIRPHLSWQYIFVLFGGFVFMSMVIINFIRTKNHRDQVEGLEKSYISNLNMESGLLNQSEVV